MIRRLCHRSVAPESRQKTARFRLQRCDAPIVAWIPLPSHPAPSKRTSTSTGTDFASRGAVRSPLLARQRSAKNHWVQGSPLPPLLTAVVITLCHNAKHDFPICSPRRTHLESNQSNPSELIPRIALPVRSLNHTHPIDRRDRGNGKCQQNSPIDQISGFRTMFPPRSDRNL